MNLRHESYKQENTKNEAIQKTRNHMLFRNFTYADLEKNELYKLAISIHISSFQKVRKQYHCHKNAASLINFNDALYNFPKLQIESYTVVNIRLFFVVTDKRCKKSTIKSDFQKSNQSITLEQK